MNGHDEGDCQSCIEEQGVEGIEGPRWAEALRWTEALRGGGEMRMLMVDRTPGPMSARYRPRTFLSDNGRVEGAWNSERLEGIPEGWFGR